MSPDGIVAPHIAVAEADIFVRVNQPIVQSLMIPLRVAVRKIFGGEVDHRMPRAW